MSSETSASMISVQLEEILTYLRGHPHMKLTVQDVAVYAGCSIPTLNRLFRRHEILLLARSAKKSRKPPGGLDLLGCVVVDRDPIRLDGLHVVAGVVAVGARSQPTT